MRSVRVQGESWLYRLLRFSMAVLKRMINKMMNRALLGSVPREKTANGALVNSSRKKLVVGLGNPGMNGSRHSVGMAVISALAERLGVSDQWKSDRQVSGEVIVSMYKDTQLVFLKPKLLMNVNGVSVTKAANKFSVQPKNIILIHDELDKPLGKLAIKHGGSARGHNGVRSCIDCLQTNVMPRLRIGIGRPIGKTPVDRYVLGRFSKEELIILSSVLEQSVDLLLTQLTEPQLQTSPQGSRRAAAKSKESKPLVNEPAEGQAQN